MLWERQIVGYKLHTSVTHTGPNPDHSWPVWIVSSAQEPVYHRLHSDYCFRRRGEGSVRSCSHPGISTSAVLQKCLVAINSAGTLPIKQKHRAAGSCEGGFIPQEDAWYRLQAVRHSCCTTYLTLADINTSKPNSWLPTVSWLSPCCCHQPTGESPWSLAWYSQYSTESHTLPAQGLLLSVRLLARSLPLKKGIWKDFLYLSIDFYTPSHSGSTTQSSWALHLWSFITG